MKRFLSLTLLAFTALGGITYATDFSSVGANVFATLADGTKVPAVVGYTTDGSGALLTLGNGAAAADSTTVGQSLFATITGVGKVPAMVLYTTDGSGALQAISTGNAATATALAADPADCAANRFATAINASGTLTCAQVGTSALSDTMPKIVAAVDATSQTANIGATLLYTPSGTHLYRIFCSMELTGTAQTSSTLGTCQVNYTSHDSNQSFTKIATGSANSTANVFGAASSGQFLFKAKTGTAINYVTSGYVSSGSPAMNYATHFVLEQMD